MSKEEFYFYTFILIGNSFIDSEEQKSKKKQKKTQIPKGLRFRQIHREHVDFLLHKTSYSPQPAATGMHFSSPHLQPLDVKGRVYCTENYDWSRNKHNTPSSQRLSVTSAADQIKYTTSPLMSFYTIVVVGD